MCVCACDGGFVVCVYRDFGFMCVRECDCVKVGVSDRPLAKCRGWTSHCLMCENPGTQRMSADTNIERQSEKRGMERE